MCLDVWMIPTWSLWAAGILYASSFRWPLLSWKLQDYFVGQTRLQCIFSAFLHIQCMFNVHIMLCLCHEALTPWRNNPNPIVRRSMAPTIINYLTWFSIIWPSWCSQLGCGQVRFVVFWQGNRLSNAGCSKQFMFDLLTSDLSIFSGSVFTKLSI